MDKICVKHTKAQSITISGKKEFIITNSWGWGKHSLNSEETKQVIKKISGTRKAMRGKQNWFTASSGTRLKRQREKKAFQRRQVQKTDVKMFTKIKGSTGKW